MNCRKSLRRTIAVAIAAAVVSGAAGEAFAAPGAPSSGSGPKVGEAFTDPFAYCAAVGTVDAPDGRYAGPRLPQPIVDGLLRLQLVMADAPSEIIGHAAWRCMEGKVLACHFGNNIPCLEKADTGRTPTFAMREFCAADPASEVIPAYVTGRATVYQWRCTGGAPVIVKQLLTPDPRGFLAEFWHEVNPE